MAYTPQQLRHLAKHCRTLAITSGCGRPQLLGLAKEFEAEALAEENCVRRLVGALLREHDVPRYFFSFDDGEPGTADLVGRDLPSDEAAKAEAVKLAAEVGLDRAIEGQAPPFKWIEVTDEAQRAVVRLPVVHCAREPNRST